MLLELSAISFFTSTFARSLSACRRAWPTQRIRFCRSSPCIVGSSFSKFSSLVWSTLSASKLFSFVLP